MTRFPLAVAAIAATLALSAAPSAAQGSAAPAPPRIRVEGNHFVDPDGHTFVFRGVSSSDPDRLERLGHWNRAYFQAIRSWNANVVRFPVHPSAWRSRGEADYLKLLDQGVEWAREVGLYVIIDWHSIGNLRTELFQNPSYNTTRTETFRFWRAIAEHYAGNPTVAFYELFNEPTTSGGKLGTSSWAYHKATMEELIGVIRAYDPATIPLVAGFDWAYDLTPVREAPISYPGVAYVVHPYPQKRPPPWPEKWEHDFGFVADTYPVVATEIGFMTADEPRASVPTIGDETYGNAIIDYFNRKGISWVAWVFDPVWTPHLIQDWSFTPTRQGRFFRARMMELNR
ncbi:MAG TPA: cellulase family glycosylhydrolase [Longimicrobiaceae bacterium]|nr:cellulase family glycosylhydrolase [Longimicrobiaceae bacterium]